MKLLNGGIHIFTQHPDLAMRAFYREAEQYRKDEEAHREGMEFLASLDDAFTERCQKEIESFRKSHPHLIVIQYPEAVSCFVERFFLSPDYMAASLSGRRKARVLVSVVGHMTDLPGDEEQVFQMFWGFEKKCVAQIRLFARGAEITCKSSGMEQFREKLGHLVPPDSILYRLEGKAPLDCLSALEKELGIFLGRTDLAEFIRYCELLKEHLYASFYQAEPISEVAGP